MKNSKEILEKMEKNSTQQLLFTKILCILFVLMLVCSVVTMVYITNTANQLMALAEPVQNLTLEMQELAEGAESVLTDLGTVAEELAAADLGSIVENVDKLAAESQGAVAEAMQKLDTIDIETLNKAIKDLADVVEPLAKISRIW